MIKEEIIKQTNEWIKEKFMGEGTGHDYYHVERVWKMALKIANKEPGTNLFVVEMAALLHDIDDHKFNGGNEKAGMKAAGNFLDQYMEWMTLTEREMIIQIVGEISFKGAGVPTPMSSLEGKIVQDADRLDAIGAIGIARTFAYGGSKSRPIYDPMIKPVCHTSFAAYKTSTAPTINHFYEKLLLLKNLMNTIEGKRIAQERHQFMEDFLKQFYKEWHSAD